MFIELLTITQVSFGLNYFAQTDNPVLKSLISNLTENKNFQNKLIKAKEWVEIGIDTDINKLNEDSNNIVNVSNAIEILKKKITPISIKIADIENYKQELNRNIKELMLSYNQIFLYATFYSFLLMILGCIEYKLDNFVNSKLYLNYFYFFIIINYMSYFIYQFTFLKKLIVIKTFNRKWINFSLYIIILILISFLLCYLNYWLFNSILLTYKKWAIFIFPILIILSLFIAYIFVFYQLFKFNNSKKVQLSKKIDELKNLSDEVETAYKLISTLK